MTKHIFKLIKAGYHCKKNIKKCLKQDKNSQIYSIAKLYDGHFKEMEKGDVSLENIRDLENQIDVDRLGNQGSEIIQELLMTILFFLKELKPFVRHKMA